jgi:hypothetical protein
VKSVASIVWLLVLLGFAGHAAHAGVTASLDRSAVSLSESFDLVLRVDSSITSAEPDLGPLQRDFEVLGNSRSSRITIAGGRNESYTEWRITLMPLRDGRLVIPALRIGSQTSEPLEIEVLASPQNDADSNADVMLQTEIDREEVHVQQQVLLTVRVLHAVNFSRGATLSEPQIADAVLRQLGENSYSTDIGGRRYGVFERRYAIFPQKSGELLVPGLDFQASIGSGSSWFDQFGNRARLIRLRSEERLLQVKPPQAGGTPWLPASQLTLIETWDKSPQELRIGDSATRSLTITAAGLTGAQLPPLALPEVEGLRAYPDQAHISDEQSAEGIIGKRIESSAVIPQRSGEFEIPETRLRWWDTVNQRFEEAVIPRRSIRVLDGAGSNTDPGTSTAAATSTIPATVEPAPAATTDSANTASAAWPWMLSTALLALALLFSVWKWRQALHQQPPMTSTMPAAPGNNEAELFDAVCKACDDGAARVAAERLLAWARCAFSATRIHSLGDIGNHVRDPHLATAVNAMLASGYAPGPHGWDGSELRQRLQDLRATLQDADRATRKAAALPPLYPAA